MRSIIYMGLNNQKKHWFKVTKNKTKNTPLGEWCPLLGVFYI